MHIHNIVGDSHHQRCHLTSSFHLLPYHLETGTVGRRLMFEDHMLQHQEETVVVDRQPPSPPWCRHARLVPRQDLLADEGIVCESALGTKIAEVIDQEAAALCIEALEDVHAAQPLVAPDFGITWTLSIPFNEHILWVLSRCCRDFFKFLYPCQHIMCLSYRSPMC